MKKTIILATLALLLSGCKQITAALVPTPVPEVEATPEPVQDVNNNNANDTSLHPNEITEYDKQAVTSLINEDLRKQYGKTGYYTLRSDDITFTKNNGLITATGVYTCRVNGSNQTLDFKYEFEDKNLSYVLDNEQSGDEVEKTDQQQQEPEKGQKSTLVPDKTYDFNASTGVTVKAMHNGEGTMIVQVVDTEGNLVAEVYNQSGSFNESRDVALEGGSYQLWFKNEGGGWSLSYNAY